MPPAAGEGLLEELGAPQIGEGHVWFVKGGEEMKVRITSEYWLEMVSRHGRDFRMIMSTIIAG
jgi:hypothetical protein